MTDEEINKRLHEIMGLCWHESDGSSLYEPWSWCAKCKYKFYDNTDFINWYGFGILWKWTQKHEKWFDILKIDNCTSIDIVYISPRNLAKAIVRFFETVSL